MLKQLTLYTFILLLSQCNKYDDTQAAADLKLPAYTQTGANTFGCLINGKVWANFGETWVNPGEGFGSLQPNLVSASLGFDQTINDSTFLVIGTYTLSKKGTDLSQSTIVLEVRKDGGFPGTHLSTDNATGCTYRDDLHYFSYYSQAKDPFIVTVKKDSVTISGKHIMSGTFSGMVYQTYPKPDSLRITDGVFDAGF